MKGFIRILQFSTRIPVPIEVKTGDGDLAKSLKYMPFVGGIIGLVMMFSYRVLVRLSPFAAAVTAVLAEGVITGGLHQDGLADTFDGFYCNGSRDDMLRIMKDSRLGTHGVMALLGTLLLKIAFIRAFNRPEILFVMPVYARLSIVYGAAFSKSAKVSGLGFDVIEGVTLKDALIASLVTLIIVTAPMGILLAGVLMAAMLCITLTFIRICTLKIGGMTGDTLGALGEISAFLVLLVYGLFYFLS